MKDDAIEVALQWPNKHLMLISAPDEGYEWVSSSDPRAALVRRLTPSRKVGTLRSDGRDNLLIEGDALDALRSLSTLPEYSWLRRRVKLVYVDPPFNAHTGATGYRDSLSHSVWLSMMRDRLAAIKPLLAPRASIWVHLDDSETHRARCLLDELFGATAFIATIVWQKRTTRESRSAFSSNHDYIHVYAPAGSKEWKKARNHLSRTAAALVNRDDDPRGPWADAPFTAPGIRKNQQYPIVNPSGVSLLPPKGRSWYSTQPIFDALVADSRIWFPKNGAGRPRLKLFTSRERGLVPFSLWATEETSSNDDAKRHLMSMFPKGDSFSTPKPELLMERIIHIASDPGEIVLDFFSGSGTTVAAAHKMGRRWIGIERSSEIARNFTIPRMTKVVQAKDPGGITDRVAWTGGGGFRVMRVAGRLP